MNKIVSMPIKKKWFDMILRGEKKEEYREHKPYWGKRLFGKNITHLKLINGYGKDKPYLIVELRHIVLAIGNKELGAPMEHVLILKLGEIIERGNINESS